MIPDALAPLRAPCSCAPGHTCAVCHAWAHTTPVRTWGQTLGGMRSKLGQLSGRLPLAEAQLATLQSEDHEGTTDIGRQRKRAYETVQRLRASIKNLEMRLDVLRRRKQDT